MYFLGNTCFLVIKYMVGYLVDLCCFMWNFKKPALKKADDWIPDLKFVLEI